MMILFTITGWLRLYYLYIGKSPVLSRYVAKFSVELYESCIMNYKFLKHVHP